VTEDCVQFTGVAANSAVEHSFTTGGVALTVSLASTVIV